MATEFKEFKEFEDKLGYNSGTSWGNHRWGYARDVLTSWLVCNH